MSLVTASHSNASWPLDGTGLPRFSCSPHGEDEVEKFVLETKSQQVKPL